MFDVEMDVSLTFDPPMDADGPGITVTRRFQLPFVPQKGLALTGQAFSDHSDAEGLVLQDVVWDDDRRVFLVDSAGSMHDFPIATIPDELRLWIERGWRLGSYRDAYVQEEDDSAGCDSEAEENDPELSDTADDEWEDLEKLPTMSPRSRPREFNRLMKALVREMADLFNNQRVAYAMQRTGCYFSEADLKQADTAATRKWSDALAEWDRMSFKERVTWSESVTRNPALSSLV